MQDAAAGLDFHGTGRLITPMGAKVLRTCAVPKGKIIGLDKNYALERASSMGMVSAPASRVLS